MTTARDLQHIREQRQEQRRAQRLWDADLAGRSSLPLPLVQSRTKGGVQQPSIGVGPERGETAVFHFPGVVTLGQADPRPVIYGGKPRVTLHARIAPTGVIELSLYRNGLAVGTTMVMVGSDHVEDIDEMYDPGDTIGIGATDLDLGNTQGLVANIELRLRLASS